jgi:indoleamine 2,3-dioxygenase
VYNNSTTLTSLRHFAHLHLPIDSTHVATMSRDLTQTSPEAGPSIPSGHFLSLSPSYASPSSSPSVLPSTSSHLSGGLAPNVASLASADFEVDVRTGFLPATRNLTRLPLEWELWESALDAARGTGENGQLRLQGGGEREKLWRAGIETMGVLDTEGLRSSIRLLRRAHLVLTFLLHFYVHTTPVEPTPRTTPLPIPESISVPLLAISPLLGLPPIVTYSDTVLYNFLAPNPSVITTFTGTKSEEQFYVISALCEIAGAEALKLMRQSLDELFVADEKALKRLAHYLRKLAVQIDRISDITMSLMKSVDPEEFYHLIRPWFRGGDSDGPQSAGWAFLGVDDDAAGTQAENLADRATADGVRGRLFSGPSAGQSSLIHAIDIFLTVDHSANADDDESATPTPPSLSITLNHNPVSTNAGTAPAAETPTAPSRPNEATFVQRMLQYMPLAHRTFLLHLSTHPTPLRPLVEHYARTHPKLAEAYDGALEALKRFREKHMRIVSLYIVQQARRRPSERVRQILGHSEADDNEAEEVKIELGEMRGTGGSPLFKFLKRCRDNTTKAMIGRPAGPGFDLS